MKRGTKDKSNAKDRDTILHKEIDLIQSIINRMAHNSFLLKGWSVTLIALIVTLLIKEGQLNNNLFLMLLLSVEGMFWALDAYYLRLERMYRKLYDWVIKNRPSGNEYLYDLNAYRFQGEVKGIIGTLLSKTLLFFYFPLFVLISVIFFAEGFV